MLVNNAGVMLLGPIENAPTEEWRRMIHANVFGVLYCTHAALPLMREQGSGHIVNVSSVAGRVARAGSGVYNLTKFGVGAFSESLRQEGVAIGVRVTLIEPGAVATELPGHNRPEVLEQMAKRFAGVDAADRRGHRRRGALRDRPAAATSASTRCSCARAGRGWRSPTLQGELELRTRGPRRVVDLQGRVVEREALVQHRLDCRVARRGSRCRRRPARARRAPESRW